MQLKRLLYLPLFFLILEASAISTKPMKDSKDDKGSESKNSKVSVQKVLPLPGPSPSPSTDHEQVDSTSNTSAEFASRAGSPSPTTNPTNPKKSGKKDLQSGFKPFAHFALRNKNSSASASSKSQITFPLENKSKEVVLSLLESKEVPEIQDSQENRENPQNSEGLENLDKFSSEGRSKFPRIYYGEALPYPGQLGGPSYGPGPNLDEINQNKFKKPFHHPNHFYPGSSTEKYPYPKSYVNKEHKNKNKKKRFEYKYDQSSQGQGSPKGPPSDPEEGPNSQRDEQTPEDSHSHYNHGPDHLNHEGYGPGRPEHDGYKEEDHHVNEYGHGYGHHVGHYGKADLIGKALQVLIPSALLLTGVSALFPNRIHVPTNEYPINHNPQNIRQKRSLNYNPSNPSNLRVEHRSLDTEEYPGYEFELPDSRFADFAPNPIQDIQEYAESQMQQHDFADLDQSNKEYGQKSKKEGPLTPQEYDRFHYGPQQVYNFVVPDSTYEPTSPVPTHVAMLPQNLENPQKKRKRVRTMTRVKVRQGPYQQQQGLRNRKRSRPLPVDNFDGFGQGVDTLKVQRHIVNKNKNLKKVTSLTSEKQERPGDLYLRSLIEDPEFKEIKTDDQTLTEGTGKVDLSPDGPVMGLISSYAQHDNDSPTCQKRALCELAIKGKSNGATKFESFLWNLASLVPEQFSKMYELDEIFKAIKSGSCDVFQCASPNLDLQV